MAKYLGRISHSEDIANKQYVDDQLQIALTAKDDVNEDVQAHISNTSNPHKVTKSQVGLGNVDNTSDASKPVSTAVKSALDGKADKSQVLTNVPAGAKFTDTVYTHPETHPSSMIVESSLRRFVTDVDKERWNSKTDDTAVNQHVADKQNPHNVTKSQVGLGNVQNYGVATQAQSEGGTANNSYMTPLRTKQAIDKLTTVYTGGSNVTIDGNVISAIDTIYDDSAIQAHMINEKNPHKVTKSQVALGNVDNIKQATKTEFTAHVGDSTHITSAERISWNSKQDALEAGSNISIDDNTISATDTIYTHPSSHPASMITESSTKRFVTDADKSNWNSKTDDTTVDAHIAKKDNPHSVTKAQVGLANVDNIKQATKAEFDAHNADTTKHITKAERDAWNAKQGNLTAGANVSISGGVISATDTIYDDTTVQSHMSSKTNPHGVTKAQVGLGSVFNVAQASKTEFDSHNSDTTKHITASERTAWNNKQNALGFTPEKASNKGKAGGYASLDSGGKVPASELPSYVDDVVEATTLANLPTTGETGKIYVTTNDNKTYRWSGTGYTEISASLALGTTSSTAYRGDLGNTAYVHSQATGNPHGTTKAQVGLGNVDNTSDANKPVSTAMQAELDKKVNNSQVLTDVPANAKFTDTIYSHPSTHPASMIVETSTKRFTTDAEKSNWNSKTDDSTVDSHIAKKDNPHNVTKAQVGLSNVDNTDDLSKPVSTDTQDALDLKADKSQVLTNVPANAKFTDTVYTHPTSHPASMITESTTKRFVTDAEKTAWNGKTNDATVNAHIAKKDNPHAVTKSQVGLASVDNVKQASKTEFDAHVGDATHATIEEKDNWNAKQDTIIAGANLTKSGNTLNATDTKYNNATTTVSGLMSNTDKSKLDGIAAGANNYTHPTSHPASMITETSTKRFVTDAEKSTWNSKQNTLTAGSNVSISGNTISATNTTYVVATASSNGLMASGDKSKLDGIAAGANKYSHPSSHPASMITESTSQRFVSDSEKSTWNGKQNALTAGSNVTISGNTISAVDTTYGVATTSSNGLMASGDKSKLNGIATGANNYTHPSSHPASMITESSTKRFVSDSEKKEWNNYYRGNWDTVQFTVNGNADTYYPVVLTGLNMNEATMSFLEIYRSYSWTAPGTWNTPTHKGGLNLSIDYSLAGWGGQNYELQLTLSQTYSRMVADVITAQPDTSMIIVWLRGGTALYELRRQSKDVRVTVYDGVQNALPFKNMGGTQHENVYNSKTAIEPWFNFTGIKKLLTTEDKLYIGGGYRNPKNSVEIYHENNKPTKADIGLGNVNNTSDLNKPISTATQNALNGKQNSLTAGSNVTISGNTISAVNSTYGVATTSSNGLMSSADKSKLNGVSAGATTDATANAHIAKKDNPHSVTKAQVGLGSVSNVLQASKAEFDNHVGDATHVTTAEKSTWNGKQNSLTAGSNVTISGNTISAVNTTYVVATTSANGLMSSSDKSKLNGIATGANNYTHPSSHPASIITQNASNRFVTDTQISNWNAKPSNLDTITNQRTGSQLKYWVGTQAQYDAIGTKDADTIYDITQ